MLDDGRRSMPARLTECGARDRACDAVRSARADRSLYGCTRSFQAGEPALAVCAALLTRFVVEQRKLTAAYRVILFETHADAEQPHGPIAAGEALLQQREERGKIGRAGHAFDCRPLEIREADLDVELAYRSAGAGALDARVELLGEVADFGRAGIERT